MVRYLSCVDLVEQSAQGENINCLVITSFLKQFWGHVGGSSTELHGSTVELTLFYTMDTLCLANPKSHNLILKFLSRSMLCDLISL